MEEEKLYHTLILFKFVLQSEIHSSNIPFQKKKKKKNRKNHETNRTKYISKGSIKTGPNVFTVPPFSSKLRAFFFFVLVSVDPSPANNFELFDWKSSRDPRGISLFPPFLFRATWRKRERGPRTKGRLSDLRRDQASSIKARPT